VSSVLDAGSTFWIELPTVVRRDADASVSSVPNKSVPTASSTQMTVLYIEDNLSNVHLLERIMTHRPEVTLLVATSGLVGIELALDRQPDLILLDLHLPDVPGEEVLQTLRSTARTATTPIVIISADAAAELQRTLLSAGATDYLTKPFDIARLFAVLDSVNALHEVEVARYVPHQVVAKASLPPRARPSDDNQTFHHDVNNLFGVVITYAHVLTESTDDPIMIEGLNAINESACKALALVDGVRVATK
jgi:CheY-like chemotaxis protein